MNPAIRVAAIADPENRAKPDGKIEYDIQALADDRVQLFLHGRIGGWYVDADEVVEALQAVESDDILVRISSKGGSVIAGIQIYNAIKRNFSTIEVQIDDYAMSMASVIAMAGTTRRIASTGMMMIHNARSEFYGTAQEMRDAADYIEKHNTVLYGILAEGTGKTEDEIRAYMADDKDHNLNAEECLAFGLVTDVVAPEDLVAMADETDAAAAATPNPEEEDPMAIEANAGGEPNKPTATPNPTPTAAAPAPAAVQVPAAAPQKSETEIQAQFIAQEKGRRTDINAAFDLMKKPELDGLRAECLNDMDCSAQQAKDKILAKMAEGIEPIAGTSSVKVMEDGRDKRKAGMVEAILGRHGHLKGDARKALAQNEFAGMTAMEMAKEVLAEAGESTRGQRPLDVVASAFTHSRSDFPVILEEALHKVMLDAYAVQPDTWRGFCKTGSVTDFREWNRYRTGTIGNLEEKDENGEYRYKNLSDAERSKISAKTKGNLLNISREMIIDDDMGAFLDIMQALGRASKRTVESDVYALLNGTPKLGGSALFSATNKNKASSGSVITPTSLDNAAIAMGEHKDIDGNDFLDITPSMLLIPRRLRSAAVQAVEAKFDPEQTGATETPNVSNGIVDEIITSPRLSGNGWYMFANPNEAPVFEVVFLNGEEEPFLDRKEDWHRDGVEFKARLDFGIAAVDFRGAYYNPGA